MDCNSISFNINDLSSDSIQKSKVKKHNDIIKQNVDHNSDCALIISFWGNDIDRIKNTTEALCQHLKKLDEFKDFIFVEAQKSKKKCIFSWLKLFGVKYVFKLVDSRSDGLFLKMPLWNIGVQHTEACKFIFLDSDIVFEDDSWINKASNALKLNDVISVAGKVRYSADSSYIESIGHSIASNNNSLDFKFGHPGFTLGMTRSAYKEYGKFDATNYLDDNWFWYKIVGKSSNFERFFILPYDDNSIRGFPFKIGSTECSCIHLNHNCEDKLKKYQLAHDLSYCHCDFPMEEIEYDKKLDDAIPTWKSTKFGNVMKKCFISLHNGSCNDSTYTQNLIHEFGKIDRKNPLIILSSFNKCFKHQNENDVFKFKVMLESKIQSTFTLVCISPIQINGVDTIIHKNRKKKYGIEYVLDVLKTKKIEFPKNANVVYLDLDLNLKNPIELPQSINFSMNERSRKYGIDKDLMYFKTK